MTKFQLTPYIYNWVMVLKQVVSIYVSYLYVGYNVLDALNDKQNEVRVFFEKARLLLLLFVWYAWQT